MDKSDFKQSLPQLESGQCVVVPYEIFENLFPPGIEDDASKEACDGLRLCHRSPTA
jgi:hypothetical protein